MYEYTKPRKPIAAMYNSPGPCVYGLPTLVGNATHDPRSVHNKAPAWLFGVKHGKMVDDASPGPVHYPDVTVTKYGKDGSPHYSIYGRPQDPSSFKTPGPGAYHPENAGPSAAPAAAQFSFGARTQYRGWDNNPAPNTYSLPSLLGKTVEGGMRQAPMFSQRGRSNIGGFHEDLQKTPGPGTYNAVDPGYYRKKGPSFSMYPRVYPPGDSTQRPGPGSHRPEKTPGPGTYNTTAPDGYSNKKRAPVFSLGSRYNLPGDSTNKPGPGSHSPEKVNYNRKSAPAHSFGIRHTSYMTPLILDMELQ